MTEGTLTDKRLTTMQAALYKANGPLDAEHLAFIIMLANAKEDISPEQEQAEFDFLLIMLVHEIRRKEPDERSYENLFELLNQNEFAPVESILKISQFWHPSSEETVAAIVGLKQKLLDLLLTEDPNFLPD